MRYALLTTAVLVALAASAAGVAAETVKITIKDLAFLPATVTVHVGDTIEWTNNDIVDHTATAMNDDFDVTIEAGKTASAKVSKAGTVQYYCQFHPNMIATLTVLLK